MTRLRTITEAMPMGVVMLAADGTVVEANPAAARMLGRDVAELRGRSIRELISAPNGGRLGWRIDEAAGPAPALVNTPSGTRPVQAQLVAVARDQAQPHLFGPLFLIDVSAERDAQRQLLLSDRLAALGMLVAGIGHEINNPAAYVSLGVQQIARHLRGARQQPPDEQRATLERVLPILDDVAAGVNRIAEIVGELKLFSRNPDADTAGSIDVNGVVRSAATLVQAELRSRARLSLDLGDLPPSPSSWARLSQVVLNLLINAAQAIALGGPEVNEVAVATRHTGDELQIVVRDSGCGIAPAVLSRIFDPFYTTKPLGEGTGLGLAISYDIVRRLGGSIAADSELGRGTTFTVTLPFVAVRAESAPPVEGIVEASGSVLVVDDERPLASAIARELGARMQVELVHSGGEALRALRRDRFDAVLCDLRMPDLSGAEVYRRTRARDREQAARFVFLTGAAAAAGEAEFLRQAGRPVLEKPFAMTELWRTVGAVVGAP